MHLVPEKSFCKYCKQILIETKDQKKGYHRTCVKEIRIFNSHKHPNFFTKLWHQYTKKRYSRIIIHHPRGRTLQQCWLAYKERRFEKKIKYCLCLYIKKTEPLTNGVPFDLIYTTFRVILQKKGYGISELEDYIFDLQMDGVIFEPTWRVYRYSG